MPTDLWVDSRMTSLRVAAYDAPGTPRATLVVVHGLGAGVDVLRDVVATSDPFEGLTQLDVDVLALDWPGHGRSGGRRGALSYRGAMDAAYDAVGVATERRDVPVVLLGLGIGGTLACYAALEDERVAAVASHGLLDLRDVRGYMRRTRQKIALPVFGRLARALDDDTRRHVRVPIEVLVARADRATDQRLAGRLRTHPLAVGSYDLSSLASLLLSPEGKPSLGALDRPTLVVVGDGDRVLPAAPSRTAAAAISGVHTTRVLPGAGHELLLEHRPALLAELDALLSTTTG